MMKKLICLALALLTSAALLAPAPIRAAQPAEPDFDGYLVRTDGPYRENSLSLFSAEECEEVSSGLYLVRDPHTLRAMRRSGRITACEPNYRLELLEEPPYTSDQWSLQAVNAQAAWEHTDAQGTPDMLGTGVTVAVIDSGLYREHPDLKSVNLLETCDMAETGTGMDGWHGTFVTGVIAAQVNNGMGVDGVAPDVTILPICITNGGTTTIALLIRAIGYAVEQGADVINLSIGGRQNSQNLELACRNAMDAGVLLVAAAGNYHPSDKKDSSRHMYPASYEGIVSVSACRRQDGAPVFDASYSYFNDKVTVAAPGTDVRSLYIDGQTAVRRGTSFAAPVVTGMAAIAKQQNPAITQEEFSAMLRETAADLGDPGYDVYYGHGLVDIEAFTSLFGRSYAITYELGAEDASFSLQSFLPYGYTPKDGPVTLPEPSCPGFRFLGWYQDPEHTGTPVTALPAGSVGDRTFYAAWALCYFAQYDAHGRMLSVEQLSGRVDRVEDVQGPILDDAASGSLFLLDENGVPLRAAQSAPLNVPPQPPVE